MTTTKTPEPSRTFTGLWLPRDILEANLNWIQRLLWAEVYALHSEEHGGCFASNAYLAKVFGAGEGTIANALTKLRETGWLRDVSFDGRQRVIRAVYAPFTEKPPVKPVKPRPEPSAPSPAPEALELKLPEPADNVAPEERIYAAYPRKIAKKDGLAAIRKALKKTPFDLLLKQVQNYARTRVGQDAQYTPYPASFFNGEQYNDHDHEITDTIQPSLW